MPGKPRRSLARAGPAAPLRLPLPLLHSRGPTNADQPIPQLVLPPPLAQECDNDPETGIFLTLFQGKCYPECADAGCSPDSCEDSSKCTACSTGYARKGRKW